jgi:hypothetical protein
MRHHFYIIIILLTLGFTHYAWPITPEETVNLGNELYRNGKFKEAADTYERVIKQGYTSAELYYNLGNAFYRNEQLAKSILSYERAALLNPNDPDTEHNLRLVYLKTIDHIEPIPDLFIIQWMHTVGSLISQEIVRFFFLLSWILLFSSLIVMYLVMYPVIIRIARTIFFISAVSVGLWVLMLGIQSVQGVSSNKAIITEQTVTAKSSPDTQSVDAFVIHEGLKIKLTDSVGEWVKILLADGKVGWIPADQCEQI